MARRIIKLTEADLTKIVKRVLKEQNQPIELPKELEGCFKKEFKITDVVKYPKCVLLALKIKAPFPFPKDDEIDPELVQACAKQLMKHPDEVMKRFTSFATCALGELINGKKLPFDPSNLENILKDKNLPVDLSSLQNILKDKKLPFDPTDMVKSYFKESKENKDEEVSWLWKVKKKLKGISDEQLDYNMRNDLPWDWKGSKEGFREKMEPRKKHSGSN